MGNTVKNIGGVTKEIVAQLFNEASLLKGITRKYSNEFAKDGAKIGNVLNVKYLDNIPVYRGRQMVDSPLVERTIPITILDINQYQSAISYNSADYALSIESFTEKTNLKQIARKMISEMEKDCARTMMQFPQRVGTLGTTPGISGGSGLLMSDAPDIYTNAGSVLTAMAAPNGDRTMALTPIASGKSVAKLSGLQNPASQISEQYRKGRMGAETLGFDFIENMSLPTFTAGSRSQTAGTVAGVVADGSTTITITGLGANTTIASGEHFTITGVNAVNPMTQDPVGFLQSFAVVNAATADSTGTATVTISPAISLSNPLEMINGAMVYRYSNLPINVNGTVDSLPVSGAAVTFDGAPNATGVFNIGFQKDAIVMTSVDLPVYNGADKCSQENWEGFNVRVWRDSDIKSDNLYCRVDSIVVFTMIRSQLGVVVWG